jgi:hypothetical protein
MGNVPAPFSIQRADRARIVPDKFPSSGRNGECNDEIAGEKLIHSYQLASLAVEWVRALEGGGGGGVRQPGGAVVQHFVQLMCSTTSTSKEFRSKWQLLDKCVYSRSLH